MNLENFNLMHQYVQTEDESILKELKKDSYSLFLAKDLINAKQNKLPSDIFFRSIINEATAEELITFLKTLNANEEILSLSSPYLIEAIEKAQKLWIKKDFKWYEMYLFYFSDFGFELFSVINNKLTTKLSQKMVSGYLFLDSNKNTSIKIKDSLIQVNYAFEEKKFNTFIQQIKKDIADIERFKENPETAEMLSKYSKSFIVKKTFSFFAFTEYKVLESVFIQGTFNPEIVKENIWCPLIHEDNTFSSGDMKIDRQIIAQTELVDERENDIMFGFSDGEIIWSEEGILIKR